MIYDHVSGTLSVLDRQVIDSVPPGGNWRDLPVEFDSQRIRQIRRSAIDGEGSRSTYYGRLQWGRPAYTISTYFNRPGNGCFIHPAAPRLISIREAARLQSFPDSYRFSGSGRKRYIQVGNAVPPLLAFQIARVLPPGPTVDLFAGAGGLSLGFAWAGHQVIAAVDNDATAIETLARNGENGGETLKVDLSDPEVHERTMRHLLQLAGQGGVHVLIGGPPCQGFSTAGNCRVDDPRNKLVFCFLKAVETLHPTFVLMENVPALLWRGRRATLAEICRALRRLGYETSCIIAHAEGYGVPQLRRRFFLLGSRRRVVRWPLPWREILEPAQLRYQPGAERVGFKPPPITTADAIGDLSENLSTSPDDAVPYRSAPTSTFQRWARNEIPLAQLVPAEVTETVESAQESLFDLATAR